MTRLYVAGPMSRESFCRCDRPSARGALPVATDLVGPRMGDAVLPPDVLVGHPGRSVRAHGSPVSDLSDRALLPERDLLQGAGGSPLAEQGKHVPQEADCGVPVRGPLEERLLAEPIGRVGAADAAHAAPGGHEVQDVAVRGIDLDAQRPAVGSAVDDGALSLVETGAPGDVGGCPVHDFILPDDGVDPWDFNYPAFHAAAARLRAAGYEVENPAENTKPLETPWAEFLTDALTQVLKSDGIALLPGSHLSRGARLEVHVALELGKPIATVEQWKSEA